MARKKICHDNIDFDSNEEVEFYEWIKEAKILGFINEYEYQPESFILFDKVDIDFEKKLKTKTKIVSKSLLRSHKYTADFKIIFNDSFIKKIDSKLKSIDLLKNNIVYIDIKGGFNAYQSHSNFSVERKWVWDKYNIFIERIIPESFFQHTWVPEYVRYSKKRKVERRKYKNRKLYDTFEIIIEKYFPNIGKLYEKLF